MNWTKVKPGKAWDQSNHKQTWPERKRSVLFLEVSSFCLRFYFLYTVSPLTLQVLYPRIQPTVDSNICREYCFYCTHTTGQQDYLHSLYTTFTMTTHVEMISSTWKGACGWHANTEPALGLRGALEPIPVGTLGHLCARVLCGSLKHTWM